LPKLGSAVYSRLASEALKARRAGAKLGGGEKRIETQHAKGNLTARERIEPLLDKGLFEEFDMFVEHRSVEFGMEKTKVLGDGVVTGWGTVNGRKTFVFAKDFTVFGGSLSETHALKITKLQDGAMKARAPIIGVYDAGGARIQEGVAALAGYSYVFRRKQAAETAPSQTTLHPSYRFHTASPRVYNVDERFQSSPSCSPSNLRKSEGITTG
jgi:propionyl-CoA carboxylase beta chain